MTIMNDFHMPLELILERNKAMDLQYYEYVVYGDGSVSEEEFPNLYLKAMFLLNRVTNNYFRLNDINSHFYKDDLKYAIALQIDHFKERGSTSAQSATTSGRVQIGRTSIESGESNKDSSSPYGSELSLDAYKILLSLGLLYRGVCTR